MLLRPCWPVSRWWKLASLALSLVVTSASGSALAATAGGGVPAPETTIPSGPSLLTNATTAMFTFTSDTGVSFDCDVDGGGFLACTSPFTTVALAEGTHTFSVQAIDASAVVDPSPATYGWTIDITPPIVTFAAYAPTLTNDSTPTFDFLMVDAHALSAVCILTDQTRAVVVETGIPCVSPHTPPSLLEGQYTLDAIATDAAGNTGHSVHNFTVDTTPPTVTITDFPPEPTNDATPTFGFTTGGAPVSTRCRIDGTPASDVECAGNYTSPVAIGSGPHAFYVTVIDAAGNAATAQRAFTVDLTPPETTLLVTEPARTNQTNGSFTFASEIGTTFECRLDLGSYTACSGVPQSVGGQQVGSHTTGTLGEGFHTFEVRATDNAGNVDPTPAGATWFIDLTPPVAAFALTPPNPSPDSHPLFQFSSEAGATFECKIDGASFASCGAAYVAGPDPLDSGPHTMYVRAIDSVGNVQVVPTTYTWTVDLDPPDTYLLTYPAAVVSEAIASFEFDASEQPATFECSLDGAAFMACASPFATPALPDGPHTFAVRAIDAANRVDDTPATYAWTVALNSLCEGGPFVCKTAGTTKLTIRNSANDAADKLEFRWALGDATNSGELGDPSVDTPYAVCVWDTIGGMPTLVMALEAPPAGNCSGKPCWRPVHDGTAFRYRDFGLLPDGVQQMTVRSGPLGKASVFLKGRGLPLPDPPMPFTQQPTITVQVVNGLGTCWGADYVVAPRVNSAEKLLVEEKP